MNLSRSHTCRNRLLPRCYLWKQPPGARLAYSASICHRQVHGSTNEAQDRRQRIREDNLSLQSFLQMNKAVSNPAASELESLAKRREGVSLKFHIETYGCQMNTADSDIVRSVMVNAGHEYVSSIDDAQLIFANTCAIRENAETKVSRP
jgi:hypothetical protein